MLIGAQKYMTLPQRNSLGFLVWSYYNLTSLYCMYSMWKYVFVAKTASFYEMHCMKFPPELQVTGSDSPRFVQSCIPKFSWD